MHSCRSGCPPATAIEVPVRRRCSLMRIQWDSMCLCSVRFRCLRKILSVCKRRAHVYVHVWWCKLSVSRSILFSIWNMINCIFFLKKNPVIFLDENRSDMSPFDLHDASRYDEGFGSGFGETSAPLRFLVSSRPHQSIIDFGRRLVVLRVWRRQRSGGLRMAQRAAGSRVRFSSVRCVRLKMTLQRGMSWRCCSARDWSEGAVDEEDGASDRKPMRQWQWYVSGGNDIQRSGGYCHET